MKEQFIRNLSNDKLFELRCRLKAEYQQFSAARDNIPATSVLGTLAIAASLKRTTHKLHIIEDEMLKRNLHF